MESKTVKIYTSPTCFWCKTLKSFLNTHKISYVDIDISRNEAAMLEMIKKSGQTGVPQLEVGDQIVVGFSQKQISELLNIQHN